MTRRPRGIGLLLALVFALFASRTTAQPPTSDDSTRPPQGGPSANAPGKATTSDTEASAPPPREAQTGGGRRRFTDVIPCSGCHSTTAWKAKDASGEDVKFDHSTTGFPLTGEHIHAPCVACHNAKVAVKRACISCHEDFHRGRLLQTCDTCHSPAGWRVTQPLDIHRRTRFPLTGMHVLADCTECHVRANEQRWTDAPVECFACHEKEYRRPDLRPVHVGTATSAPFPRDCSICHRALAWVPAASANSVSSPLSGITHSGSVAPLNHDLKFPIGFGAHRNAPCEDCHVSLSLPHAVRCIGCHAHDLARLMQQHRRPMATDGASCLTCHPGGTRR